MRRVKIHLVSGMLPLILAATSLTGGGSAGLLFDDIRKLVNPPGSLDETFGTNGKVTLALPGEGTFSSDIAGGVAIQRDGRIVVAGATSSAWSDFGIARFTTAGALDMSFSRDGIAITSIGLPSQNEAACAVAIQSDGKIVAAGYSDPDGYDVADMAVVRYTSNGELDPTFSGDGIATIDFGSATDNAYSVALQADGKIVVAGATNDGGGSDIAMARLTADGQLDASFDDDGKLTASIESYDAEAHSIAIQPDGKIVVGVALDEKVSFRVLRFLTDGSPDASFHDDGIGFPYADVGAAGYAVAIQSDGRIVVAGFDNNGSDDDFALVRLTPKGELDTTFGGDGIVTTDVGTSSDDVVNAIAIQDDWKIVVAGTSNDGSRTRVAVARYWW